MPKWYDPLSLDCSHGTNMANTLLFIQNPDSDHDDLVVFIKSLDYVVRHTEDVSSAITLIDDHGLRPNAILVDIPDISEQQVSMLESIEESLGVHEWIFLGYNLAEELADRLDEISYRTLQQPFTHKKIALTIKKAMRSTLVRRRLADHMRSNDLKSGFDSIAGQSDMLKEHRSILKQLAKVPLSTLMIKGETGTGKGHAASLLHGNGLRQDYSFIEMNCAAMPQELVESQLFGHEPGAFTGAKGRHRGLLEQADNGTLFLDEIGEMPLDVQAKLLKAIEEQRFRRVGGEHEINVDVQVFAASNRDLQQMVIDGEFREDLYHRLNVFEITVPSLRDYKSDLVELVPMIMAEYNSVSGKHVKHITDKAWSMMMEYDWPGNIRELRNAIERSVLMAQGDTLNSRWLNLHNTLLEEQLEPEKNKDHPSQVENVDGHTPDISVIGDRQLLITIDGDTSLEQMDQSIIERALKLCDDNLSQAAELLQTTRETLRYRVQKYGLDQKPRSA